LLTKPVEDLGAEGNETLRGIFSPHYEPQVVQRYLHAQFSEAAAVYAAQYAGVEHFTWLLTQAFDRMGWHLEKRTGLTILDLGSGAGNSIFPLLELCPEAQLLASDLSLEMLVLLKQALRTQGREQACVLLQLNAEELDFTPESFDLVVGAAVLHHLIAPDKTLAGCARLLKRGGAAIFFEPFEAGHAILRLLYRAILEAAHHAPLPAETTAVLEDLIRGYQIRSGRDKSLAVRERYEDKWLFTRRYLEEVAGQQGFARCTIYPLYAPARQFARQIEVDLRLRLGQGRESLPGWAWDLVQQYDETFSEDLMSELLLEGGTILQK
jgi:ubiquinone/menaquinone biosynthesis C-methylase UbiE